MIAHSKRLNVWLPILLVLIAAGTTPVFAQVSFNNFSSTTGLVLNPSAAQAGNVLRLTADGTPHVSGTAWFGTRQSVSKGFTSVFQFRIFHDPSVGSGPADGLSFIIQNSSQDAGFGTAARGGSGGAIGYGVPDPGDNGTAIPDSLAVEFDTYQNSWDPNANHVAIQSCGTGPNTQDHTAICPTSGLPAQLGIVSDLGKIILSDGNPHTAVVEYDPPVPGVPGDPGTPGFLRVYLDDLGNPILVVNTDLSALLNLPDDGAALVGFGGATGLFTENNDILSWTFTPANAQTTIDQTLTPASPEPVDTNYVFGSYNHKLQYSGANSGDDVQVTAIPIDQKTFHDTRLLDSSFPNAQCVIYDGTGGLCVLFRVTCSGSSDCTSPTGLNYDLFNNFNGPLINGACVLKADPVGSDNWQNIIETFTQGRDDGGGKSSSKGFSDFIFGQNCSGPPTAAITSPANGSTVIVGQNVTITFSCAPPGDAGNAPLVTLTSCAGLLNGKPVTSGQVVVFNTLGPQTLVVTATDSILDTGTATSEFTVGQVPAFTSAPNTTFQVGIPGTFTVTAPGSPTPVVISETGTLPNGVTLVSHGDGTATLSGTPSANTGGVYNLSLMANNSAGSAMQSFTLTVLQAPAITSGNNATFQAGVFGSFTVTTTGYPKPAIGQSGGLPSGVGFVDNGDGTGTLSGKPATGGTFPISFTATNVAGSASQNFTLNVSGALVSFSPPSINFGNVKYGNLVWQNLVVKNTGTITLQISKVYVTPGNSDGDDFGFLNFCGKSLASGKSCLVTVFFFADDLGLRTAYLSFADNAAGSPQQVPLSGNVTKH